jgi:hypothetical protein
MSSYTKHPGAAVWGKPQILLPRIPLPGTQRNDHQKAILQVSYLTVRPASRLSVLINCDSHLLMPIFYPSYSYSYSHLVESPASTSQFPVDENLTPRNLRLLRQSTRQAAIPEPSNNFDCICLLVFCSSSSLLVYHLSKRSLHTSLQLIISTTQSVQAALLK